MPVKSIVEPPVIETDVELGALRSPYMRMPAKVPVVGALRSRFAPPEMLVERRFDPANFKLPLGLKDIRLALEAGEAVGAPLPFASVLRDNFIDAIGHGDGDKDWSAIAVVAARRAGLDGGL